MLAPYVQDYPFSEKKLLAISHGEQSRNAPLHHRPADQRELSTANGGKDDGCAATERAIFQRVGGTGWSDVHNLQRVFAAIA